MKPQIIKSSSTKNNANLNEKQSVIQLQQKSSIMQSPKANIVSNQQQKIILSISSPKQQQQPNTSNVLKLPQISNQNQNKQQEPIQNNVSTKRIQSDLSDQTIPRHAVKKFIQTNANAKSANNNIFQQDVKNSTFSEEKASLALKPKSNSYSDSSNKGMTALQTNSVASFSRKSQAQNNLVSSQKQVIQKSKAEQKVDRDQTFLGSGINKQKQEVPSNQKMAAFKTDEQQLTTDQTVPRKNLNKPTKQPIISQKKVSEVKQQTKESTSQMKQLSNNKTPSTLTIKEQFLLDFKEANKTYNLMFSLLSDSSIMIEDHNQIDSLKQQYYFNISKDLNNLIQSIKQNEEVELSTQQHVKKNIFENLTPETLSELFFQILSNPPSRKVLFTFIKINMKDLVSSKKENEQFLKACLDQQISKINNESKDKSTDRYQFLELLGKGGQGEVWLYYDTIEKKTIVFKKFFKGFQDSYSKEKLILKKIKEANLCPPIISFDDSNYVIQSEKGELSLMQYDEYIKNNKLKMYSQNELFYILRQLVLYVKILHEKYKIFHCDIKPDNIVLVSSTYQTFQIKMIDFGGSVDDYKEYPGCYTPAYSNPQILNYDEEQLTENICVEGELYCIARTLCKLGIADSSLKMFCKRSFIDSIHVIGEEYNDLKKILIKILEKKLTTCDQVLQELETINHSISESIKDSDEIVKKIQQEKLQKTQNNMDKDYLLQQVDFYEQMYAFKKGVQTIKTLLNKYTTQWTEEERKDLIMKQTRFEMEIQGIQDLSNIIQSNGKLMGENGKYFDLLLLIVQKDANIDQIIKKSQEITNRMPQKMSNEAFIMNDIIATLLERKCAFDKAIEYRIMNMEIARLLTDKQIPLYTPTTQLASCYEYLGLLDKAFEYYTIAMQSALKSVNLDSTNLSNAYQNLSIFFKNMNAFQKAEDYQQKSLQLRKVGTPDYCNSMSNLASIKEKLGFYKEAIQLYQESLTNLRKILGNDHIDVGYILNNMSLCLQKMGDIKNALSYCLESYEILKFHLGEKHSIIATCLGNVGDCYRELQEFTKALQFAEKSLKINEEISGKDSLYTSNSLEKIGLIYYQQKQYEQAIQNLERSLRIKKNHKFQYQGEGNSDKENGQGSQDYQISVLLNNLALAYEGMMLDEKSLELQLESLSIKKKLFENDNHPSIGISQGNIGMTLFNLARFEQSIEYLNNSIKVLSIQNYNKAALQVYEKQLQKAKEKIKNLKI